MESVVMAALGGIGFLLWSKDMNNKTAMSDRNARKGKGRNGVMRDSETGLPIYESQWPMSNQPAEYTFERAYTGEIPNPTEEQKRLFKAPWFQEKLAMRKAATRFRAAERMDPDVKAKALATEPFSRFGSTSRLPTEGMADLQENLADIPSINDGSRILNRNIQEGLKEPIAQ